MWQTYLAVKPLWLCEVTYINTGAQLYADSSFVFTCKTCLHQTAKPLSNALFSLPNLCLHQIQRKTVGGRHLWIFTWSENGEVFFFQAVWERTIRYSLCNVHKTKPTQNPCWQKETTSLTVCTALPPGTSTGSPAPPALQHQHWVKVWTKWFCSLL